MYFFYHRVNNWNQSRESETWNEKAERRRVREVTVSYFLWDAALISLHLEAVGGSQITSCSTVLHKPTVINVFAHKSVLLRRKSCRCATNSDHNVSFFVRARACLRVTSVEDLLSAACLLMRGDLTDCPMWLIWRRAKLCSTPTARPHRSSENTFKSKRKLHIHTLTHNKGGLLPVSHNNCAQEPFMWKITLLNQSLIEILSSGSGQSGAHNVLSPWNNGQSVAHDACRHVDPDQM